MSVVFAESLRLAAETEPNGLCDDWSECGDSNPGPPAPKAGALPTAQHPDLVPLYYTDFWASVKYKVQGIF